MSAIYCNLEFECGCSFLAASVLFLQILKSVIRLKEADVGSYHEFWATFVCRGVQHFLVDKFEFLDF